MRLNAIFHVLLVIACLSIMKAQDKPLIEFGSVPDSMIVFRSPRPLITDQKETTQQSSFWSVELLFSGNGFGAGCSFSKHFSSSLSMNILLGLTGNRNSDELEYIDQSTGSTFVPDKVNRLFSFPLTFGLQKRLFRESLSESFRPFIGGGIGYAMILQVPYNQNLIQTEQRTLAHGRPAAYLSLGSAFGNEGKTSLSALIRYYVIPFGGTGLDSIKNLPITDFGGLFIALGIGFGN